MGHAICSLFLKLAGGSNFENRGERRLTMVVGNRRHRYQSRQAEEDDWYGTGRGEIAEIKQEARRSRD
jgi:hypothetical protein